jgi:hypothetical protein
MATGKGFREIGISGILVVMSVRGRASGQSAANGLGIGNFDLGLKDRNRWNSTNRWLPWQLTVLLFVCSNTAWSTGTPAGTVIDNVAMVNFDLAGVNATQNSNTVSFSVLERLDVVVTLQSGQVPVAPNQADAALLFSVTNTGNGDDEFALAINSALAGDDFDPIPAVPAIYFDTDVSGDFSAGDIAYQPGVNDPQLVADESVDVLLINNIPAALANGQIGRSELTATSTTGTGVPGETLAGLGDGGLDAVLGASGGQAAVFGEYLVADVNLNVVKSVVVSNPLGGTEPIVGATLTYTITVEVLNGGISFPIRFRCSALSSPTAYR